MEKMIMGKMHILIGIGIIGILLLALAGTGSAHSAYGSVVVGNCGFCHSQVPALNANGTFFKENHKFDGLTEPITSTASCTNCHTNLTTVFLPLTSNGSFYNSTHRYNDTTLASTRLAPPACSNCHVDVSAGNFAFISGAPTTYLKSTTCENCHKTKYDNWRGTMHRVMLTNNSTAQDMGLPTPPNLTWTDMPYAIVGKDEMRYLNESGYLFKVFNGENGTFTDYGPSQYTCGRCHTTGYNASGNQSGLPGIVGTWSEPGIACERCHGPAGNGHQVEANVSEQLCLECHNGSTRQGLFLSSAHSPPLKAPTTCLRCHSPFDYARNRTVTSDTAVNVVCANCHNSHNTSDDKYRELFSPGGFNQTAYADVKDAKNSFFNSTASRLLLTGGPTGTLTAEKDVYDTLNTPALIPTDRIDESYPGPINVTGPISEVLCSNCHYEHGLSHIAEVNLTHARLNYPALGLQPATCTDCHMSGTQKNHSFNVKDETNFPSKTCSRGTECHVTSDQNLNHSIFSLVPEVNEWRASLHNDKVNGGFYNNSTGGAPRERESSCSKCHSPTNWNPLNERSIVSAEDFNGITCAVCHNIHDMGDWLKKTGKPYAWYNKDAIPVLNATGALTRYKANYSVMENTTQLCGNCHSNDNPRIYRAGPGWNNTNDTTPIRPHGWPAKDIFVGSWKQTNLGFECISCHMATKATDPMNMTEIVLPDSQKVKGHSFKVNVSLLQSNTTCAGCHTTGTQPGNLSATIETIQMDTQAKWNTTNTTVMDALGKINAFTGEKNQSRNMIADAYWKLQMVSSEGSWGVHNPVKVNNMLNESSTEATDAVAALGSAGPGNQTGNASAFTANLSGNEAVPPVNTQAKGNATFALNNDGTVLHYTLMVENIENVTMAHIHQAPVGVEGPIVAWLYPEVPPAVLIPGRFDGLLAEGNITSANLTGPLANQSLDILMEAMMNGSTYVNVHTEQNPNGEIRGQIKSSGPGAGALNITSFTPAVSTVSDIVGGPTRTFTIDVNQNANISWKINETEVTNETGVTTSSYTNSSASQGIWNVTALAQNANGSAMQQWTWVVNPTSGATFKISGFKTDNNGTGLANWNITLTKPDNTTMNSVTDSSGMYQFMNLPNGTYTVAEQMQPGWTNVSAMSMQVTIGSSDMMNQNFTNKMGSQQPNVTNVTSFELTPDKTAAMKGSTITITVKAININITDTNFNGIADITVNASKNASDVIYPLNVTFNNGMATLPVTSNIAQIVTVTATNGSITGSTNISFADIVFDLDMGWNLISIPNFADPSSVDMILKNVKNNGVVGYDPGNKTFSTPDDLQPLYGYWINVTAPNQSIGLIVDTNIRSIPPSRDLFEGWNLIGVVASKQELEQNKELDAGTLFQPLQAGGKPLYSYLVSYKNPSMTYTVGDGLTDRTPLNKGQGYWLFMNTLTETNKDNLVWAGKPWLSN